MTQSTSQSKTLAVVSVMTAMALCLPHVTWLWPCPSTAVPAWAAHTVLGPLIALFVTVAFLAPGLAIASLRHESMTRIQWIARGAFWSVLWHVATGLTSGAVLVGAAPDQRALLETTWTLALPVLAWIIRLKKPGELIGERSDFTVLFAVAGAMACGLGPALWTREFSSDGLESYVLGRSLDLTPFPLFLTPTGGAGLGSGGWLQAYLIHALFPLVGDAESTPRFLLVVAAPVIVAVAHTSAEKILGRAFPLRFAMATAVVIGLLILALHASFDLHITDPSSPAAWDAVGSALLIALVAECLNGSILRVAVLAALTALARPSGILVASALAASLLVFRPSDLTSKLIRVGTIIVVSLVMVMLVENVLIPAIRPGSEEFLTSGGLKSRLRSVTFHEQGRWIWLLVASGGAALLVAMRAFRRTSPPAHRALAFAAFGCAGLFTLTRGFAPHHMMPSVALLWLAATLILADSELSSRWTMGVAFLAALILASPTQRESPGLTRNLGATIAVDQAVLAQAPRTPRYLTEPFPRRTGWSAFTGGRGTLLATAPHVIWLHVAELATRLINSPFRPKVEFNQHLMTTVPIVPVIYGHVSDSSSQDLIRIGVDGPIFDTDAVKALRSPPALVNPVAPALQVPFDRLFPRGEPKVGVDCDIDFKKWFNRSTGK